MNNDNKYNGWTNYETWNVKLWIDNDQGTQEYWNEMAQEILDREKINDEPTQEEKDNAVYKLSKSLQEQLEEENPVGSDSSMWADLMSAALSEVNWYEIAEAIIEDLE